MSIQEYSEAAIPDDVWMERHVLSREESRELFDQVARRELGISGDEFVRRWRAGEYEGRDESGIREVMMLLPLAVRINLDGSYGGKR
jgi:hypothetical protein